MKIYTVYKKNSEFVLEKEEKKRIARTDFDEVVSAFKESPPDCAVTDSSLYDRLSSSFELNGVDVEILNSSETIWCPASKWRERTGNEPEALHRAKRFVSPIRQAEFPDGTKLSPFSEFFPDVRRNLRFAGGYKRDGDEFLMDENVLLDAAEKYGIPYGRPIPIRIKKGMSLSGSAASIRLVVSVGVTMIPVEGFSVNAKENPLYPRTEKGGILLPSPLYEEYIREGRNVEGMIPPGVLPLYRRVRFKRRLALEELMGILRDSPIAKVFLLLSTLPKFGEKVYGGNFAFSSADLESGCYYGTKADF